MYVPPNTLESLRSSIDFSIREADEQRQRAERSKDEALRLQQHFNNICTNLKTTECPFCKGKMIDTSDLEELSEYLGRQQQFLFQGELFTLHCQECGIYLTDHPKETAQYWKPEDVEPTDKVFAVEIFKNFPTVDEVALERAAGRGWMFRIENTWYATFYDKARLKQKWGMK